MIWSVVEYQTTVVSNGSLPLYQNHEQHCLLCLHREDSNFKQAVKSYED